jgi:hypothetical protein
MNESAPDELDTQADSGEEQAEGVSRSVNDIDPYGLGLGAVLVAFAVLSLEFLRSDLWFDELLTLHNFAMQGDLAYGFTHYPIANNHIWFTFVLKLWLLIVPLPLAETMRLPCLVMAVATIWLMYRHAAVLFGKPPALLLAMMLAFSPLFMNFSWQLRGYGLSMLLATLALFGALYVVNGDRRRGLFLFVPAALFLPGVVPSNLLVTVSLAGFIGVALLRDGRLQEEAKTIAVCAVAAVAGMALYLPVLDDFKRVASTTAGWDSGGGVLGHWVFVLAAHAGMFMLACVAMGRQPELAAARATDVRSRLAAHLPLLFACCLAPLLVVALVKAPFPRSFLAYLPVFTVCTLWCYRDYMHGLNKYYFIMIFFLLGNGLVWMKWNEYDRYKQLIAGETPQDLMVQFYARNADVSASAQWLARSPNVPSNVRVFVPFHYFLSFKQYWYWTGRNPAQVDCLKGSGLFKLQHGPDFYERYPQAIVAYNAQEAVAMYKETLGIDVRVVPLARPGAMTIFQVVQNRPPPRISPNKGVEI